MLKKIKFLFALVPFALVSCGGNNISSQVSSNSSIPDISFDSGNSSLVSSSEENSSSSTDPLENKEGLDLLLAIFETYLSRNSTIEQTGVSTEYFMGDSYYIEYSEDYLQFYGDKIKNHGFIINPVQGIYEFVEDFAYVKVTSLVSTQTNQDWMYDNMLNSPEDLYYFASNKDMWKEYDVENPPVFEEEKTVKTMGDEDLPAMSSEKQDDLKAKAVFYSTDPNVKLLCGILGQLSFQENEDHEYDTSTLDMIKVRINQDNSLTFLPTYQGFHPAIYDIKNVDKTKLAFVEDFFDATPEEYEKQPYGKETKTGWTSEEKRYFAKNYGYELPFPTGASYALKTYSSSTFAAFTDDACGDLTASYIKQLEDAGWTLLVEEEGKETESATTYYITTTPDDPETTKDETKQVRVTLGYSAPESEDARWNKGTFSANIHRYPYMM